MKSNRSLKCVIERQGKKGRWHGEETFVLEPEFELLWVLADYCNDHHTGPKSKFSKDTLKKLVPICKPRGVPDDASDHSKAVAVELTLNGAEVEVASWVTLSELEEYKLNQPDSSIQRRAFQFCADGAGTWNSIRFNLRSMRDKFHLPDSTSVRLVFYLTR